MNKPTPNAEPTGSESAHTSAAEGEPAFLPRIRMSARHMLAGTLFWVAMGGMLIVLGTLPTRFGPVIALWAFGFCLVFLSPVFGVLTAAIYVGRKNAERDEWNSNNAPLDLRSCEKCGHWLRGLTSRRCPECGQPFRTRDDDDAVTCKQEAAQNSSSESA